MIQVRITKLDPRAQLPEYKTPGAAAFDLATIEDVVIPPKTQALLRTGLGFGIPKDHVLYIHARSSLFQKHKLMLANGVGVIDSDYSGPKDELLLSVWNASDEDVSLAAGTRVSQGVILQRPEVTWVEEEATGTDRGGFGSTGH
ncbi:MAG: dUTP diphosphatase [Patescibacteria group bacterium]